jgi:leucyl-tRNA synthetase
MLQVNGKTRGDLMVPVGTEEAQAVALALAHPKIKPFTDGKTLAKVIYVTGKILNLVVR